MFLSWRFRRASWPPVTGRSQEALEIEKLSLWIWYGSRSSVWHTKRIHDTWKVVGGGAFPSSINRHFQNEAKCTTFLVKMSFICMRMKSHFRIKGWALNLVLIQRLGNGLFGRREKFRGREQTRGSSKPPPFACSLARSVKANKRLPRRLHLSYISSNEKKTRSAILSSAT